MAAEEASSSEEEEEDDLDMIEEEREVFECVVCDKVFKSRGALRNHEGSKAHRAALSELRDGLLRCGGHCLGHDDAARGCGLRTGTVRVRLRRKTKGVGQGSSGRAVWQYRMRLTTW